MKPPYAIGSVPSLSGHAIAYRWRSLPRVHRHRASKPQGSSERVLLWQITMDQLIFASLSHTHYWFEVGMLKVPAVCVCVFSSHSFWTSSWTYQPGSHRRKVTQNIFIHHLSAVRALIFLARRIRPFLSLVDREVEFCVLTI